MDSNLKRSIIIDNYQNPVNRKREDNNDKYEKINTRNVSCIDNLDLYINLKDGIISDITFEGEACVISIASTSILINKLIGKSINVALEIIDNYLKMINEEEYDETLISDLVVFDDVSKQPSRIKCATLTANGIKKYLMENK